MGLRATAVVLGVSCAAVPSGAILAQERPDTVFSVLEGIEVVVGSRAGVADPANLAVAVDIYGAEEITRLGEVDLAEVLGRIAPSFNSTRFSAGRRGGPSRGDPARHESRPGSRAGERQAASWRCVCETACRVRLRDDRYRPSRDPRARHQTDRGSARRRGLAVRVGRDRRGHQHRAEGRRRRGECRHLPGPDFARGRTEAAHVRQRGGSVGPRLSEHHDRGGEAGGDEPGRGGAHLLRFERVLRPLRERREDHSTPAQRRAGLQGSGFHVQCGPARQRIGGALRFRRLLGSGSGCRRALSKGRLGTPAR